MGNITLGLVNHQPWQQQRSRQPKDHNTMPTLVESVVEGFPLPTVNPIVGKPNYESIAALHQRLNANLASVPSHVGNGALGLLYLTVSSAVYANFSGAPFVPPTNPGPTPIIPDGAQGPQIANIRTELVEATKLYKQYSTTDKALKQLLVGAVDKMFTRRLQTKHLAISMSPTNKSWTIYTPNTLASHLPAYKTSMSRSNNPMTPTYQLKHYSIKSKMVLPTLPPASRHTPPNKS
jgi:hypothetical protein